MCINLELFHRIYVKCYIPNAHNDHIGNYSQAKLFKSRYQKTGT